MMPSNQYWDWFWTDAYYRLLIGGPMFILMCIGMAVKAWYDNRADDQNVSEPENFSALNLSRLSSSNRQGTDTLSGPPEKLGLRKVNTCQKQP